MIRLFSKMVLIATSALFVSTTAHALVEARLTYGLLMSKPDYAPLYTGALTLPGAAANYGVGVDALAFIPLTGWGFGVRYENMGATASAGGLEFKSTATRTSVLVAYRIIDTIIHLGPIFSYGLSHTNGMKVGDGTLGFDWKPGSSSSYSVGLEAGLGLGLFLLGAEAGYQNMKWNSMKDGTGTSANTPNTDMSGTYAKVFFGFGI